MYNDSGIYCYKNIINGKLYIGQSVNLKKRHKAFLSKSKYSGSYFQKAIDKYGKENFSYSILTHCKITELNYYEAFYIQRLKTYNPHYGYNLTTGGDSAFQRTEICKEKMRDAWDTERRKEQSVKQKGCNNYNYGKKWNQEQKKNASKIKKEQDEQRFLKINGFPKKELPEQIKQHLSNNPTATRSDIAKFFHTSHSTISTLCDSILLKKMDDNIKVKQNLCKKPIVQCDINNHNIILNIFPSLTEAEKITNIKTVSHCVYGKQGHGGGYFWRYAIEGEEPYAVYNEQYLRATDFKRKISKEAKQRMVDSGLYKRENLYKKVYQYDKEGKLVRTYKSVKETENFGFCKCQVSSCCKNNRKQNTHKGFVFSYTTLTPDEIARLFNGNLRKSVIQLTLNGDLIKEWESATVAGETLSLQISNITACCNGRVKTCGGFKWKYKN